jgi:hypothetical protein
MRRLLVVALLAWCLLAPASSAQYGPGPVSGGSTATVPVPTMANTGFTSFTTQPAGSNITMADSPVGISMASTDQGRDNINAACKNTPAVPYTVTTRVTLTQEWQNGDSWAGLVWRNPTSQNLVVTGALAATDLTPHRATVYSLLFSDPITFTGSAIGNATDWAPYAYIRYSETSANWIIQWSADGVNFLSLYNGVKTAGYSQICIYLSAHGGPAAASFNFYSQTSP